jgi:hypothetical protein
MKSSNAAVMTLRESVKKLAAEQAERYVYFSKLYGIEGIHPEAFDNIESEDLYPFYPSNKYFPITIYIDPTRIDTEEQRAELLRDTQKDFSDRIVRMRCLDPDALNKFSVSHGPGFERLFLERGYATNVEGRTNAGGRSPRDFKLVEANKKVLQATAHIWTDMLTERSKDLFDKSSPEEIDTLASAMLGKPHEDGQPIPLVRFEDLLLGVESPKGYSLYLAYSTTPREAITEGQRDCDLLFVKTTDEALDQIKLEFANAHLLFGDHHRAPLAERHQASSAILVWFSQVVAAQRRIVWDTEVKRKWMIELRKLFDEKDLHKHLLGVEGRLKHRNKSKTLSEHVGDEIDTRQDEAFDIWGLRPDCIHEISLEDRMLAALNGAAVDVSAQSEWDYFESKEYLIGLARWIGELKRTRKATFNEHVAKCIRLGWSYIANGDNCLLGQFPETTWLKLVSMAGKSVVQRPHTPYGLPRLRIEGFAGRCDVTYEWVTPQTHHEPTACSLQDGVLALRGPLICFPFDQLAHWKRKALMVSKLKGFWAPRR